MRTVSPGGLLTWRTDVSCSCDKGERVVLLRVMDPSGGLAVPWGRSAPAASVYVNDPAEPTRASSCPSVLSMTIVRGTVEDACQFVTTNGGASTVML